MRRRNFLIYYTFSIILIFLLKLFQRDSVVDDLLWILAPISKMVTFFCGIGFEYRPGTGFVSLNNIIVINKSCSGINFGTILIALGVYHLISVNNSWYKNLFNWIGVIILSFSALLIGNSLRISLASIPVIAGDKLSWFSSLPNQHLVINIFSFVSFLVLYNLVLSKIKEKFNEIKG